MRISRIFISILFLFNSVHAVESREAKVNEKYQFIKTIYHDSWALIIGINNYQYLPSLDYAVNDANSINEILIQKYGFKNENILLITDGDATKNRILKGFQQILLSAGEKDRVVVFYAGHGDTYPLPNGGEMGYLIPVDGDNSIEEIFLSSIPMSTIEQLANMSPAKHILYLVDACYGGLSLVSRGIKKKYQTPEYLEKMTQHKGRQVITAGGKDEPVFERAEWGHSAFTKNLISGLKDDLADVNNDGIISGEELGTYVQNGVSIDTKGQHTPQKGRLGSDQGEFVFISQTLEKEVAIADQDLEDLEAKLEIQAKQIEMLMEIQQETIKEHSEHRESTPVFQPKSPPNIKIASTLAWVFPGLGHYYSGRVWKGLFFTGLELAALYNVSGTIGKYENDINNYDAAYSYWKDNQNNPGVSQADNQAAVTSALNDKNRDMFYLVSVGTISTGIWIWNILDVKKSKSKNYSTNSPVLIGINYRGQIEARISF